MNDLVSIIMPCHNGAQYIAEAINSVLDQSYHNWELLIIDDCSKDNSVQIVTDMMATDNRIKLYHTSKSTGFPSTPRNEGLKFASGRFIAFLDCDDKWISTKLDHQLPLFENDNIAVVFSWYKKIDEKRTLHEKPIKSPAFVSYKELLGGNVIGNLTGIYDTKKVGKVFQKQIHHEDYLMWLEILNKGFLAMNTNTIEAIYRESKTSISSSKIKSLMWTWQLFYEELKIPFLTAVICFIRYALKGIVKFAK